MVRRSALLGSILLGAAACGEVVVAPGGNGGAGGATVTTPVGTGGGWITSESTTSEWTTSGTGGVGPTCFETHDTFSVELGTYDGHFYSCQGGESGTYETDARVTDVSGGFLGLDSCPPSQQCPPLGSKLTVAAPDLYLDVPVGAFVHVRVLVANYMGGCTQKIQITNLPSWGGVPNPVMSGNALWLLASDGDPSGFDDSPVALQTEPLGCFPGEPPGCGPHEDYALRFFLPNQADPGVTVAMGETGYYWLGAAFPHDVTLRNLRSFSLGYCDGPSDYAYWVTHQYGLD